MLPSRLNSVTIISPFGASNGILVPLILLVVHHHYRPGGVRRVIELATPYVARHAPAPISRVILVGGEAPDETWLSHFQQGMPSTPVEVFLAPALGYAAEQASHPTQLRRDCRKALASLMDRLNGEDTLVWCHNPGLARNLIAVDELARACLRHNLRLVAHHHDWWFDNRWQRWPEFRSHGHSTLQSVAKSLLHPAWTRHFCINQEDASLLSKWLPGKAAWLPNPGGTPPALPPRDLAHARAWLTGQLGDTSPVWLVPCRLLRRKNIAEALLLARLLRPEAWLVTTGAPSSPDEQTYADRLEQEAQAHEWRLRLSILRPDGSPKPSMTALMAASEAVLLTSAQEGFGLPYIEAALARKPLIARSLPNVAPDLANLGFRFPQYYEELWIDPSLFDSQAEVHRQENLFRQWRSNLPLSCRRHVTPPPLAQHSKVAPIPFSRLTLTAQLEVLHHPLDETWSRCLPLNPWLERWRNRAARGTLQTTAWPRIARTQLSGDGFAARFWQNTPSRPDMRSGVGTPHQCLMDFIRLKVRAEMLYPLLMHNVS